jgi:6-pyruvoyltetrahydropterin/6-carboxytetrahydropterin synthase
VKIYETEHNMVEYMGEGELDEAEGQVDVALIKLMGVDIKQDGLDGRKKKSWSLDL